MIDLLWNRPETALESITTWRKQTLEGARISLLQHQSVLGETTSDSYGEFRFDGLVENSGQYDLVIKMNGKTEEIRKVVLGDSQYVGLIKLK